MAKRNNRETILIIEDEPDIRDFVARLCQLEGYRVLQAEDGEAGLRLAEEERVDLVLLDLRLPKIDGWTVLKELKSNLELSSIPVVIFTASAAVSQRDRALDMGAVDYLVKPLSAATLKEIIAHILHRKGRQ